jgi:3-oxoacyl-[acyl-carrier protein] reductase
MNQANIFIVPGGVASGEPKTPTNAAFADFDKIQPGDEAKFSKLITAEDVEAFAKLSGDRNPLHMDDKFAARTHFQRRVVHGMLMANYVSTLVGMHCPGPGALWSQQNFRWPAPVFIGDRVDVVIRVTHKSIGSRTLKIELKASNQDGKVVMEGEGTVTALEEQKQIREASITERVALITGGATALTAAIAAALASAGAMVAISYFGQEETAQDMCATIEASGGRALAVQAEIDNPASILAAVEHVREAFQHPVDILVNNSGSLPEPRPFMQTSWDDIQKMLDEHVRAAFHCSQAVIPGMIEQKSGRIINIGSVFTRNVPPANWTGFLLAKSALLSLTRSLAAELGPQGIRVNMVSPGLVESEESAGLSERLRKVQAMQTPLRRLASAADIAAVVASLSMSAGDFITGAEIPVCGGLQM